MAEICRISMCPPVVDSKPEEIEKSDTVFDLSPERFIIEFESENTTGVPEAGAHFSVGDIIGVMDGKKIKATVPGEVIENNGKYIICRYENEIDVNAEIERLSNDDSMNKAVDILKENQHVSAFIKDFILRFRFADLAMNASGLPGSLPLIGGATISKICKKYSKDADKIIKNYETSIKKKCGKDNIMSKCGEDNLLGLKKEIDDETNETFAKIIEQARNTKKYGASKGRILDFMLYSEYMEYTTSDDFYYDDENPYIVELFDAINRFMKIRSKIEMNGSNINGLVTKFNSNCDEVIGQFWTDENRDYYSRMKEIFKYDFYTTENGSLKEAGIWDEGRTTLYTEALEYLKNLTGYQPPVSPTDQYKNMDVQDVLKAGEAEQVETDTESAELMKSLKKIALSFVSIRKIENDADKTDSYFSQYISKSDLNNIFSIGDKLKILKIDIKNYSQFTTDPRIMAYSGALKKYLGALKSVTDDESKILKELTDKAINWYLGNHENIESGKIFEEFDEIPWPSPTVIKKDGVSHDFYFLKTPNNSKDDAKETEEDNYEYTETSIKTKHGIDSYEYWLKYCTTATIVNCMLPMYWSTGLIVSGAPVMMPIIFVPIHVLPGRVTVVMGLGICGTCPLPMLYFVNMGDLPGFIIPAINALVDMIKNIPKIVITNGADSIKKIASKIVSALDKQVNDVNKEINSLDIKIENLKNGIKTDFDTLMKLKETTMQNFTSNRRKNGAV